MNKPSQKYLRLKQTQETVRYDNISVSCTTGSGIEGAILNVIHHYPGLRDVKTGFNTKMKAADCNGMRFADRDVAMAFAYERGYLKPYFTQPEMRTSRKATKINAPEKYRN